jgi:ERCC4-related helicase
MPINPTGDRETCQAGPVTAAQPLPPGVSTGARVTARGIRWTVEATLAHDDCRELHLLGGDPPARRVLLWPFDRPVPEDRSRRFRSVRLGAWAANVGGAIAGVVDPLTPRARASTAAILPYQLAPAVAMAGGASRVLLADEVGLGKTIQAGWIIADLIAREPASRILVAVPAGLRRQWRGELAAWFDLAAIAADARWLRGMVCDLPADVSPWTAPGVYLGSVDFLKRVDVARSLERHVWDLLVVDEAHTATSPTERYAALAAVAARARRVVTITATPYSGDTASFASLAALGASGGEPPPLMFRRSREDAGDPRRRRHRFAAVRITRGESRLQRLLERYSRDVWRDAPGNGEGARLAVTILRKRALSSPAAAARSLRRRLDLLLSHAEASAPRQLTLFDEEDDVGDDLPEAALAAPGLADATLEQRWLTMLVHAADAAVGVDSKLRCLRRLLNRVRGESVIVFTEYRDTLLQLAAALPPSLQLHGGLTAAERASVQARFNDAGGLLLATDAAAEGLNLQRRCRLVVNYELPWNPARLEQRIGRVDRIGQQRTVHAITLVARDTAEDLVIANLARRLTRIVATLGEKDRLGAFLNDARTARMVIAGAPEQADEADDPPAVFRPAPAAGEHARAAADRLSRGPVRDPQDQPVFVSTLRATRGLPAGFVVAIRCGARTEDGEVVATRVVLVHAARDVARPPTPAAARATAATALAALPDLKRIAGVASWFAAIEHIHERSIDGRRAREAAMQERRTANAPVQPGLFDRRAMREADESSGTDRAIHAEHRRRIEALDRARRPRRSCIPVAVLVVWR